MPDDSGEQSRYRRKDTLATDSISGDGRIS